LRLQQRRLVRKNRTSWLERNLQRSSVKRFSAHVNLDSDDEEEKKPSAVTKEVQIARLVNHLQMSKTQSQKKSENGNGVTRSDARVFASVEQNNIAEKQGADLTPEEAMLMRIYIESFENGLKKKGQSAAPSKLDRFKDLGLNNTATLLTSAMVQAWPDKHIDALQARAKYLSSKVCIYHTICPAII
jgi:hypothetical protein